MTKTFGRPGDVIDRDMDVPALIFTEFSFFNDLQRHYAPRYNYPEEGSFIERITEYAGVKAHEKVGQLAVINKLLLPDGENLSEDVNFPMTYRGRSATKYNDSIWAQPVIIAGRYVGDRGHSTEVGVGWKLKQAEYYSKEVSYGKHQWFSQTDRQLGICAVTLFANMVESEKTADLSMRLYASGSERIIAVPKKSIPAKNVPAEAQKDFLQIFHDAVWDSVSEPA